MDYWTASKWEAEHKKSWSLFVQLCEKDWYSLQMKEKGGLEGEESTIEWKD